MGNLLVCLQNSLIINYVFILLLTYSEFRGKLLQVVDRQLLLKISHLPDNLLVTIWAKQLLLFSVKGLTHCGKIFG